MNTKTTNVIIGILVFLSFGMAVWAYPQLPATIASHWNIIGQVDGYMDKFWGLLLFPLILAGLWLLSAVIPMIDPMKGNLAQFRSYYNLLFLTIIGVLAIMDKLLLLWQFGNRFPIVNMFDGLLGILILGLGLLLPKTKRNFFMGIRTPWTLSSDKIWDETHRWAGKLFFVAGICSIGSSLFPSAIASWVTLTAIGIASVGSVVDSYRRFRIASGNRT